MGNVDLHDRLAIVTGASSGLGEATARVLAAAGATVCLAVRDVGRGRATADRIRAVVPTADLEVAELELGDQASVRTFVTACADRRVDVLVNNAGAIFGKERTFTVDGFESHAGVNLLGHVTLTAGLTEALLRSDHARVVMVTSLMAKAVGSFDPRLGEAGPYTPSRAYGQAKLACGLFGIELDRRAKAAARHLTSVVVHPGWASTNLFATEDPGPFSRVFHRIGRRIAAGPDDGAGALIRGATDLSLSGGEFIGPRFDAWGPPATQPVPLVMADPNSGKLLWELAQQRTGVRWPFD
ncbi:SDR family NAD(P)-dependent oxidoreductase [Microlunatus sp. Y2014]|uniref:SDR family NAD(P)-dependent oxidoreductase n=1 Tax=Microlunatus sp. Y2014 TaxID=3418488 RepID=UPI003DA73C01